MHSLKDIYLATISSAVLEIEGPKLTRDINGFKSRLVTKKKKDIYL